MPGVGALSSVSAFLGPCTGDALHRGTFMLVVTVGLNVMGRTPDGAWSIACALMSMIYALGDVSGAHFNPAVTVAIFASGRRRELTPAKVGFYICAQAAHACDSSLARIFIHGVRRECPEFTGDSRGIFGEPHFVGGDPDGGPAPTPSG